MSALAEFPQPPIRWLLEQGECLRCRVAPVAAALVLLAGAARAQDVNSPLPPDDPPAEVAPRGDAPAEIAPRAATPAEIAPRAGAQAADPQRQADPPRPGEVDASDDPDAQAEVDKSSAELEAVRKAEEKAGLLPQAPGAGAHDGLQSRMDAADPFARDLAAAQGGGLDGAPLADPRRPAASRRGCPSCSASRRTSCAPSTTSRSS